MRYRLRTLLICLSLLAVLSAAVGWSWRRNRAEQQAVRTLAAHRVHFEYTRGVRLGALEGWVDARLGREFRSDVSSVHLDNFDSGDPEVVAALRQLPGLKHVKLDCWPGSQAAEKKLKSDLRDTRAVVEVEHVFW